MRARQIVLSPYLEADMVDEIYAQVNAFGFAPQFGERERKKEEKREHCKYWSTKNINFTSLL